MAAMMSAGEIVASYRRAAHKDMQIRILAQLNACPVCDIVELLQIYGLAVSEHMQKKARDQQAERAEREVYDRKKRR